ncbi:ABC transporter ATP-binding protein [Beggiatoa leptomitoformis]|uniref:ATP-binding cassette domain-containing protein n=1 Tax=Beggiatoa leptomitoformis TaxID=288004 RepID=A0A2N9YJ06_9GAMM|nr:ABC transporter transmembrane domain-containing protein [Beggiatoa leptomitoformis]ALG67373.1 ATP-binding cassette domain-containing protein [Beggiatoa leptomitoformis]AUI70419.1 ATP-binding cassette domain-containing protein [Beggiatoa leptomitoformis]
MALLKRQQYPHADLPKRPLDKSGVRHLLGLYQFTRPYRGYFLAAMVSLFFSSTVLLAFPFLAGRLIDTAMGKSYGFVNDINELALLLIAVLAIQSIFSFFRIFFMSKVTESTIADIRKSLYEKFMTLPMHFYDNQRAGELISRLTADVGLLQDTFSVTLSELIRQTLILVIGVGILFIITPELTIFMLLVFPVLVLAAIIFGKFIRRLSRKTQDELAKANIVVEETLQSISMVKAFTNEAFEVNRYAQSLNQVVQIALSNAKYRGAFISFIIFALFGSIVLVLWYGASLVKAGTISIGDLSSFIIYTMFIGGSIGGLGDIYSTLQKAVGATERIVELLDEPSELSLSAIPTTPLKFQGAIEYQNVSFAYPTRKDTPVLKGINIKIQSGEKVALVGYSGAGKSTLIQLLLRFYNVDTGKILLDGKPIEDYNLTLYRHNIGIVPQEVILFGGTIRENILYGNPNASEAEITNAANQANALEFINNFPEGLDTLVGERGVKLSGGQRQRIAIARAILKDPTILILDEATSSLDAESERLVQQALEKLMEGRTTIVIAHRLATIRKVDRIYVIDEGNIAESGAHEELANLSTGIYNNLLKLQFAEDKKIPVEA